MMILSTTMLIENIIMQFNIYTKRAYYYVFYYIIINLYYDKKGTSSIFSNIEKYEFVHHTHVAALLMFFVVSKLKPSRPHNVCVYSWNKFSHYYLY